MLCPLVAIRGYALGTRCLCTLCHLGSTLKLIKTVENVALDALLKMSLGSLDERHSGDMLVKLYVAVTYRLNEIGGHLGNLLAGLAHEIMLDEPLAHELLAQLFLSLAFLETLLVAIGIEVA